MSSPDIVLDRAAGHLGPKRLAGFGVGRRARDGAVRRADNIGAEDEEAGRVEGLVRAQQRAPPDVSDTVRMDARGRALNAPVFNVCRPSQRMADDQAIILRLVQFAPRLESDRDILDLDAGFQGERRDYGDTLLD